jgi:hypothetical protein
LESVTLNTSLREQNHHQFKTGDDAPQKNIKQAALLKKVIKPKLLFILAKKLKFLVKYNIPAAGVLSSVMALLLIVTNCGGD